MGIKCEREKRIRIKLTSLLDIAAIGVTAQTVHEG